MTNAVLSVHFFLTASTCSVWSSMLHACRTTPYIGVLHCFYKLKYKRPQFRKFGQKAVLYGDFYASLWYKPTFRQRKPPVYFFETSVHSHVYPRCTVFWQTTHLAQWLAPSANLAACVGYSERLMLHFPFTIHPLQGLLTLSCRVNGYARTTPNAQNVRCEVRLLLLIIPVCVPGTSSEHGI